MKSTKAVRLLLAALLICLLLSGTALAASTVIEPQKTGRYRRLYSPQTESIRNAAPYSSTEQSPS